MTEPCKHCEARPRATPLGLCAECDGQVCVRLLYEKTRRLAPEREDRLRILAERARRRLPLFDDEESDTCAGPGSRGTSVT
jgi:hypothetical protein